jgi:hypothetical protein
MPRITDCSEQMQVNAQNTGGSIVSDDGEQMSTPSIQEDQLCLAMGN